MGIYYYEKPKKDKLIGIYGIEDNNSGYLTRNPDNLTGYNLDQIFNEYNPLNEEQKREFKMNLVDLSNSSRVDNVVNIGINENSLHSKYNFNNIHYLTVNNSIYVNRDNGDSNVSFNLIRTKFNIKLNKVNIKRYNNNPEDYTMSVPSEFIDISITTLDDSLYRHFVMHPYKFINKIDIEYGTGDELIPGNTNKLLSYNLSYIVSDLHHILFKQSNYIPWLDMKYGKRIKRLFIMYLLESEDAPDIIRNDPAYKRQKITNKITKFYQMLDLIEKINNQIQAGNFVISDVDDVYNYLNYTSDDFKNIITDAHKTEENYIYHSYANSKLNDTMMPKLINSICFNLFVYCLANQNAQNNNLIRDYLNSMNKQFLYYPFDDFNTEYINKIYDRGQPANLYGNGLFKEIKNSIICTLKTFAHLREYKERMVNIMVNYRNTISQQHFNTIYGINNEAEFDAWLNAQNCD